MAKLEKNSARSSCEQSAPLAIIAGNGMLPVELATRLQQQGHRFIVIALGGEADEAVRAFPHEVVEFTQIGLLFKLLKKHDIERVVLAGGVVGRPEIAWSKLDWGAVRSLPGLLAAQLGGDNAILKGVISVFEKRGIEVCSVAEIMPDLITKTGSNTVQKPRAADIARIVEGATVSGALGRFDIGQACVVIGQRAIAVEGAEGTDAMLQRVTEMRLSNRLPKKKGGVLVKSFKPGQDERADLPTIGPNTIRSVHEAGLDGIGVQAGRTLIVERETTLQLAQELGVFVFGFDLGDPRFAGVTNG